MFAGHFIGSIAVSPISDKFGRKIPLFIGGFFCCLFNFVSAFSPAFWVFALFRAFIGFAIGKSEILSWRIYNIQKTRCVSLWFPNTKKEMKGQKAEGWVLFECLGTLMKMNHEEWVFEMTAYQSEPTLSNCKTRRYLLFDLVRSCIACEYCYTSVWISNPCFPLTLFFWSNTISP